MLRSEHLRRNILTPHFSLLASSSSSDINAHRITSKPRSENFTMLRSEHLRRNILTPHFSPLASSSSFQLLLPINSLCPVGNGLPPLGSPVTASARTSRNRTGSLSSIVICCP